VDPVSFNPTNKKKNILLEQWQFYTLLTSDPDENEKVQNSYAYVTYCHLQGVTAWLYKTGSGLDDWIY
jgi:hypothetical protein